MEETNHDQRILEELQSITDSINETFFTAIEEYSEEKDQEQQGREFYDLLQRVGLTQPYEEWTKADHPELFKLPREPLVLAFEELQVLQKEASENASSYVRESLAHYASFISSLTRITDDFIKQNREVFTTLKLLPNCCEIYSNSYMEWIGNDPRVNSCRSSIYKASVVAEELTAMRELAAATAAQTRTRNSLDAALNAYNAHLELCRRCPYRKYGITHKPAE